MSEFILEQLLVINHDHSVFLLYIHEKVVNAGVELDRKTRFLLQNMDMVGCMDKSLDTITETFDTLLHDETSSDFSVLNKLHRRVCKEYIQLQRRRMTKP